MPYRGLKRFLEKAPGGLEGFYSTLPDPRVAAFLDQPFLASGMYDVFPLVPLFAALARVLAVSFEEAVRGASMQQCRYDAKTVFRAMFSRHGPDGLVPCFPRFNARYFDFGKFAASSAGPNRVRLETAKIPAYAFIFIGPMHLAYAEESLRVVGARAPSSASAVRRARMARAARTRSSAPGARSGGNEGPSSLLC